jgi:CRP/FNR family transcriptional regulator, cyclic AMP receptor protein
MGRFSQRVISALTGRKERMDERPYSNAVQDQAQLVADKQKYLSEMEIFCDLAQEEMDYIARTTTMITTPKGKVFYFPEDAGEVVFLLKKGKVQLYRLSPEGRKLIIAVLSKGSVFGEMSLIGQGMYNTFAEAVEDCLICVMSRSDMVRILSEKPQVALRILETIGSRLLLAENQLEEIAFRPVPVRLALLLLRLSGQVQDEIHSAGEKGEEARQTTIAGLTHQELADMIGTYRETVSATLNDFKAQRLVELAPKCITLLDVERLRVIARG